MFTIGIIGNGYVGKATHSIIPSSYHVLIYDINPNLCYPPGTQLSDLKICNLFFICVPSPPNPDGFTDLTFVTNAINNIKSISNAPIILRSTVPVGTSDSFGVSFWPEFLRQNTWKSDMKSCKRWILGTFDSHIYQQMSQLLSDAHRENLIEYPFITQTSPKEAELIKYGRNTFLALKVSYFNELYDFCSKLNIDFETVRANITNDIRINSEHSFVPGPDGKRGFGGACLPKDSLSLYKQFEQLGLPSYIIKAAVDRNSELDQPNNN